MAKFKEGDIVYHKATDKRGVITEPSKRIPGAIYGEEAVGGWYITWKDGTKTFHREAELLTEEEHNKKSSSSIAGPQNRNQRKKIGFLNN